MSGRCADLCRFVKLMGARLQTEEDLHVCRCCVLGTAHPTTTIASVLSSAAFPADNNDLDDLANIGKIVRSAPKESVCGWVIRPSACEELWSSRRWDMMSVHSYDAGV